MMSEQNVLPSEKTVRGILDTIRPSYVTFTIEDLNGSQREGQSTNSACHLPQSM